LFLFFFGVGKIPPKNFYEHSSGVVLTETDGHEGDFINVALTLRTTGLCGLQPLTRERSRGPVQSSTHMVSKSPSLTNVNDFAVC